MNPFARLDPGMDIWRLVALGAGTVALIVGLAGLLGRLLARRDPATSHAIDRLALVSVLLVPTIVPLAGRPRLFEIRWPRRVDPPAPITESQPPGPLPLPFAMPPPDPRLEPDDAPAIPAAGPLPEAPVPRSEATIEPIAPAASQPFRLNAASLPGIALACWAAGTGMLTLRLIHGLMSLPRLRRRATPLDPEVVGTLVGELRQAFGSGFQVPEILEVPNLHGPLAGGPIRPTVFLPEGLAATLDPSSLQDILIHECAHVLRKDPLFGLLQRVASAIYWPHPAVHLLNRRMSRSREAVCDNHVLARGRRASYARTLLELTQRMPSPPPRHLAVIGLWETLEPLEARVRAILDERRPPVTRPRPLRTLAATLTIALFTLPLAGLRLTPPAQAGEADPTTAVVAAPATPTPPPAEEPPTPFDPTFGVDTRTTIKGTVVDEKGQPVPGIAVNGIWFRKQPRAAITGKDGSFELTLIGPMRWTEYIQAKNGDGTLQGFKEYREPILSNPAPFRIVLKPARKVAVVVKDRDWKPVTDASVTVQTWGIIAEGRTNAEGWARFLIPVDARVNAIAGFKEAIGMDYHLIDPYHLDMAPSQLPDAIVLRLDGAQSASVKVVDEKGVPRSGFRVYADSILKRGKSQTLHSGLGTAGSAITDANGVATFRWLPTDLRSIPNVEIFQGNDVALAPCFLKPGSDTPAEFKVARNVTFSGTLTNPDGSAIAGAMIACDGYLEDRHADSFTAYTRTRPDGSYSFKVAPDRVYTIAVLEPGIAATPLFKVHSESGRDRPGLNLTKTTGGRLTGKLVGPGNKPVPDGSILVHILGPAGAKDEQIRARGGNRDSLTTSCPVNERGEFDLTLAPGSYQFQPQYRLLEGQSFSLTVTEATNEARTFLLAESDTVADWKAVPIVGTTVDGSKDSRPPVPGSILTVLPFGRDMYSPPESTADQNGFFRFDAPGEMKIIRFPSRRVIFSPEGKSPQALLIARSPDGSLAGSIRMNQTDTNLRISMTPAASIAGRVVNLDGTPRRNMEITLIQEYEARPSHRATLFEQVFTDRDGRFRFPGVLVGVRCRLIAYPEGRDRTRLFGTNEGLLIQSFATERPGVIDASFNVEALVLKATNPKKADVPKPGPQSPRVKSGLSAMSFATSRDDIVKWIEIINRDAPTQELIDRIDLITRPRLMPSRSPAQLGELLRKPTFLDLADRASLEVSGRKANTVELVALGVDYRVGHDIAFLAAMLRDIGLSSNAPILKGVVKDKATGQPIKGALVWGGRGAISTRTDGRGAFSIPFLPAQRYIRIEADHYAFEMPVVTRPGEPLLVQLRAAEAATGRVVNEQGQPIAGVRLRVIAPVAAFDGTGHGTDEERGVLDLSAVTDEGGIYSFPGLPPGTRLEWFAVEHPTYITPQGRQTGPRAGSFTRLTLSQGCILNGTVRDPGGKPVEDASLTIWGESGQVAETDTDHEGRFRLRNLPPQRYEVVVHGPGDLVTSASVELKGGTPTEVVIDLEQGRFLTGTVVNEKGAPVPGVAVGWGRYLNPRTTVESFASFGPLTRTGAKGEFRLGPLPRRPLQLTTSRMLGRSSGSIAVWWQQSDDLLITDTSLPLR